MRTSLVRAKVGEPRFWKELRREAQPLFLAGAELRVRRSYRLQATRSCCTKSNTHRRSGSRVIFDKSLSWSALVVERSSDAYPAGV